ncbi:MAG: hypothetical protein EXR71_12475 [Myxococcales bacterium]|nr:hypothetical protein [Myxococcales bacterium]
MSRRAASVALIVALGVLGAVASKTARVPDAEMSPSLFPGDLVLILDIQAREGDIVAVTDPLDPARWTLRRVESMGGAVAYDGRAFRTSNRPKVRVLDMGEYLGRPVFLEGTHLTLGSVGTTRLKREDAGVPDDSVYLGADDRDHALDSRWWGPVPLAAISGVVVLRVGATSTPWRRFWGGRGEPAIIPESSKLGRH